MRGAASAQRRERAALTPMRLVNRGKGPVAVPKTGLPALTAALVRKTLTRDRR